MELLLFLLRVLGISLSGALTPGPVTTAAIAMGAKNRFAGPLLALGHGIIEFPLMVAIVLGADRILTLKAAQTVIGLAGGAFLAIMGLAMLRSLRKLTNNDEVPVTKGGPIAAGIILSGSNPYFLLWWATVGLALATTATGFGIWAFVLFAIAHWSCDLAWLTILSWASFKGSVVLGPKGQKIVLLICALALIGFGIWFIIDKSPVLIHIIKRFLALC